MSVRIVSTQVEVDAWVEDFIPACGDIDDALTAFEDWTEGPFRPSDWSPRICALLASVTPRNSNRIGTVLYGF